jgi:hypothetical protein
MKPKNVIYKEVYEDCHLPYCPNCLHLLTDLVPNEDQQYCMYCGQKLIWIRRSK